MAIDISYRCIVADPPWAETGGGQIKRGADRHYALLKTPDIVTVMRNSSCWRPDPSGCHLWLWATNNHLRDGLHVMNSLGFRYVNLVTWTKAERVDDSDTHTYRLQRGGLGQYFSCDTEQLLFGVMGTLPPVHRKRALTALLAPRRGHSVKPTEAYGLIETVSPGPRVEMFVRRSPPAGWDAWPDIATGDCP